MKHEINMSNYNIRTDLAIEAIIDNIEGITTEVIKKNQITITDVTINSKASQLIGKKPGNYLTIEFNDVTDFNNEQELINVFTDSLKQILEKLKVTPDSSCLIVGLGNANSTPDSLGPLAVDQILVTNHLFKYDHPEKGFRPVSVFKPGVMGETGMETADVIASIVSKFNPSFVIVIDALASSSLNRVNKTIQMTDTGIHPGSGVGNSRGEISKETIKVPVLAIGIPTVVDAVTIVSDTINYMQMHYSYSKQNINNPTNKLMFQPPNYLNKDFKINKEDKTALLGIVGSLSDYEIKQLIYEVLSPIGYNLMVTPKEVDFLIQKLANIIGKALNKSLHLKVD